MLLQKIVLLSCCLSLGLMAKAQEPEIPPPPIEEPLIEEVYAFVEEQPYLKMDSCANMSHQEKVNCSNVALMEYLKKNIRFSANDILQQNEGRVYVQYTINKNGKMEDFKILKNTSKSTFFEYEAKRVFNQLNQETSWEPGKIKGAPVKSKMVFPIRFQQS